MLREIVRLVFFEGIAAVYAPRTNHPVTLSWCLRFALPEPVGYVPDGCCKKNHESKKKVKRVHPGDMKDNIEKQSYQEVQPKTRR